MPGWELDEISDTPNLAFHAQSNTQPNPPHQPMFVFFLISLSVDCIIMCIYVEVSLIYLINSVDMFN